jgi:hypothetical protein
VKINSKIRTQPVTNGPTVWNKMGLIIKKAIIAALYQFGVP